MCFKSKQKVPKTNPDALKAPEPVLIEEPKGVEFGADGEKKDDDQEDGIDGLKVAKSDVKDEGDGSSDAVAVDTGISTVKKVKASSPIKRAMKKVTK